MNPASLNHRSCLAPCVAVTLWVALACASHPVQAQDAGAPAQSPDGPARAPDTSTAGEPGDAGVEGEDLDDVFDDERSLLGGDVPEGGAPAAAAPGDTLTDEELDLGELRIEYDDEDRFRTSGAVTRLDERQLRRFGYDDPTTIVTQAPGVYVRTEDGFGLRPNIGIRGGNAERSKKLTLMEDGVLFGPAPYSAPAAYYFPLMMRMTGVEVFKGPAAILFGPNTVGGALDLTSRDIPDAPGGALELAAGTYGFGRAHAHYGASNTWGGFLAEVAHVQSDGFKRIDGSDDPTGFSRTEVVLRGRVQTDQDARVAQRLDLRLGYGREVSNETYLGLSDADFRADPNRRYAATQLDRMAWDRTQLHLAHKLLVGNVFELTTTAYRHDMARTWRRFDRIGTDLNAGDILLSPTGARRISFDVLTGAQDAVRSDPQQAIYLANNTRGFVSQGLQTMGRARLRTGAVAHDLRFGARLHYDQADYDQTLSSYWMESRRLVPTGDDAERYSYLRRFALAFATHAAWALEWRGLRVTPGARLEVIEGADRNRLAGTLTRNTQVAVMPGVGLSYALGAHTALLAGVNRGFSPVAPGQPDSVRPEYSINYEAGARWRDEDRGTLLEAVGFFNDYSNLTGECSFASGCGEIDRQFNGGRVFVWGAELVAAHTVRAGAHVEVPLRATYTYTGSSFRTAFESENPQFGDVEVGDALPYVPEHQLSVQAGVERRDAWQAAAALSVVSAMREEAGQGDDDLRTDAQYLLDLTGRVRVFRNADVTLRLENVLFQDPIGSRRPFGARPVRPFQAQIGFAYAL
jgi:Fe(3+) dicitrate transport protein